MQNHFSKVINQDQRIMNIQTLWRHTPITLILLIIFVLLAVIQWIFGVSIDNPSNRDLVRFGANFLPLSLTYEPWRLISSGFLHIGIIHLLFNSFAMYYFGQAGELIFGRWQFLLIFLWSVIGGGCLTLLVTWWQIQAGGQAIVSAGASGGIMGLGMAILMAAWLKTWQARHINIKHLAMVMGLNLVMGFAVDGVDNAGHIGGLLVGGLLGVAFALQHKKHNEQRGLPYFWAVSLVLLMVFTGFWWVLQGEMMVLLS